MTLETSLVAGKPYPGLANARACIESVSYRAQLEMRHKITRVITDSPRNPSWIGLLADANTAFKIGFPYTDFSHSKTMGLVIGECFPGIKCRETRVSSRDVERKAECTYC